jgi:glycosyltransferase involved in cell wall biosynthesis
VARGAAQFGSRVTLAATQPDRLEAPRPLRVMLVDPSLFTAPYDAALTEGLLAAGAAPEWIVRPLRRGDREQIPARYASAMFYRHVDEAAWLPQRLRAAAKGLAHAWGLVRLTRHVAEQRPDVVHFQWTVLPLLDALAIRAIRRHCPVLLTVHDTQAFNGEYVSLLQNLAFDAPLRAVDAAIVHTRSGRDALLRRGFAGDKLTIIPHGPLPAPGAREVQSHSARDGRYTFVLFGEIKHYKGVDVLIEAVALLPPAVRAATRFVVAGRPRMDLGPLHARIAELGLDATLELREWRLSEQEMAELFRDTHCFVFPYRQIDASGVYFMVKSLPTWIIATRVGVFAEDLEAGDRGTLIAPEAPAELALAMERAFQERPLPQAVDAGSDWTEIGETTLAAYRRARRLAES